MGCKSLVPLLTSFAVIVGIFLCIEIKRKQCEFGILYELNLIFVLNIGHVHLVHLIMLSQLLNQMYNVQFLLQLLPSHRKDSFILCHINKVHIIQGRSNIIFSGQSNNEKYKNAEYKSRRSYSGEGSIR